MLLKNRRQYFEKLREKRRQARERAQKIKEERKRAREVKEEKWTTKNEYNLVSEHRKVQRCAHLDAIRHECAEMQKIVEIDQKEKNERKTLLRKEIDDEIKEMSSFIDETCKYYDEILEQTSPPEEKSVEQIVADVEKELKAMFDIFESCFEFEPTLPEPFENDEQVTEKDKTFAKDIAMLEEEISKNKMKSEMLVKEIAMVKNSIETENVRFAAVKKDKQTDQMLKVKRILKLEENLKFVGEDPVERGEIVTLCNRMNAVKKEKNTIERMLEQINNVLAKK